MFSYVGETKIETKMLMASVVFIMFSFQKINFSNTSPNHKSYFGR